MGDKSPSWEQEEASSSGLDRLRAKELEDIYISRFERNFKEFRNFGQIYHPMESRFYNANASEKEPFHSNKYRRVIEVMKKNKIFDRSVLDEMPLNEISRFEIYQKRFFGKKILKIVVGAICLNPIKDLIKGNSPTKLGLSHVEEAVKSLVRERDVFYYLGVASTSGWKGKVRQQIPKGINWIVGLVEHVDSTHWNLTFPDKDSWNGMEAVFDPETDTEKVTRSKNFFKNHKKLRLKGGHILLDDLYEEIGVPDYLFVQALEDVLDEDRELEVKDVGGKKILRRKRI